MDDGAAFLTGPRVAALLGSALEHAGGRLVSWRLDHVDQNPEQSTTATYLTEVDWSYGRRTELLGVSARSGKLVESDGNAEIFHDGNRSVAVWRYPEDPELPGLPRAAYPERVAQLLNQSGVLARPISVEDLKITMVGYRPRRRAVVRMLVREPRQVIFVKVLRPDQLPNVLQRHRMLQEAGFPSPKVAFTTEDGLLGLWELAGRPLARALFDPVEPCSAENLVEALDAMPAKVGLLRRRAPWSDAVGHYAQLVATAMPELASDLDWGVRKITAGLADFPPGGEPTHGDFHEGQIRVDQGRISGVLDIDTIGPGRRADDLACLVAHLSTIQRMTRPQRDRVVDLLRRWVPVFDRRVDPAELRLRTAGVVISLATGPYRSQETGWQDSTRGMVRTAISLIKQVS